MNAKSFKGGKKQQVKLFHYLLFQVKPAERVQSMKDAVGIGKKRKLINALATYVPNVITKSLLLQPSQTLTPSKDKFPAAILFIDVSGFTALNERLAQLGPRGPEQVSKHLNKYFGQLIEVVTKHGGDVLKFAGDALICMFGHPSEKQNSASELSVRAIQCGMEIQTDLKEYDSNEGFKLTLHIGVGAGDLYSIIVGGVDGMWEFLVVGDPLVQLKTAVDNSSSGEVVVSKEVWALVEGRCAGEARKDDFLVHSVSVPLPPPSQSNTEKLKFESEGVLRAFIPPVVQIRFDAYQFEWLAELRQVTVLFVKLSSLSFDKTKELDIDPINDTLKFMQSVVFKYEGMVRQFLVDDKGTGLSLQRNIYHFNFAHFSFSSDCRFWSSSTRSRRRPSSRSEGSNGDIHQFDGTKDGEFDWSHFRQSFLRVCGVLCEAGVCHGGRHRQPFRQTHGCGWQREVWRSLRLCHLRGHWREDSVRADALCYGQR